MGFVVGPTPEALEDVKRTEGFSYVACEDWNDRLSKNDKLVQVFLSKGCSYHSGFKGDFSKANSLLPEKFIIIIAQLSFVYPSRCYGE